MKPDDSGCDVPSIVIVRSCMASSSAACVLGGVRLISSASRNSVNIGPLVSVKHVRLEIEQVRAHEIARHQVGRELDALEIELQA